MHLKQSMLTPPERIGLGLDCYYLLRSRRTGRNAEIPRTLSTVTLLPGGVHWGLVGHTWVLPGGKVPYAKHLPFNFLDTAAVKQMKL